MDGFNSFYGLLVNTYFLFPGKPGRPFRQQAVGNDLNRVVEAVKN